MRRLAIGLLVVLAAAAPAGADIVDKKQSVDDRIATLQTRVEAAQQRESALRSEIDAVSGKIQDLEREVGDVSDQLVPLEHELTLRELKLNRLNALYRVQAERLGFLREQYRTALTRLSHRLVAAYESATPDDIAVLLSSRSFSAFIDGLTYVRLVADHDRQIVESVRATRDEVASALARTKVARADMLQQAKIVAVRVHQVRVLRDSLVASRGRLADEQQRKKVALESLSARERADAEEIDALQAVSAELAARIRAAQATSTVRRGSGALIWPVNAPITSPYGMRWGRMHEGIDLGAAYGTPIAAAAAGTVIYAGWMEGYGNLTVLDHGGGLSTAYGHQSNIAVALGQQVTQGQIIGNVGSTGHSTGPHLHFEVRVNGAPVDPLGYL
jgi:murein DD-endopeptidase MepM/ murein hydrolase activator NlpD